MSIYIHYLLSLSLSPESFQQSPTALYIQVSLAPIAYTVHVHVLYIIHVHAYTCTPTCVIMCTFYINLHVPNLLCTCVHVCMVPIVLFLRNLDKLTNLTTLNLSKTGVSYACCTCVMIIVCVSIDFLSLSLFPLTA